MDSNAKINGKVYKISLLLYKYEEVFYEQKQQSLIKMKNINTG